MATPMPSCSTPELDAAGEGLRATIQGLEDWLSTLRDVIRNEGLQP